MSRSSIPVNGIKAPASFGTQVADQDLLFTLDQIALKPEVDPRFHQTMDQSDLPELLSLLGLEQEVHNDEYDHFEPQGKIQASGVVSAQVSVTAGTAATVILTTDAIEDGYFVAQVGMSGFITSNPDVEFEVTAINAATRSVTLTPISTTMTLATVPGGTTLNTSTVLHFYGRGNAGEASDYLYSQVSEDKKITSYVTEIRADYKFTDKGAQQIQWYNADVFRSISDRVGTENINAWTYKNLSELSKRFKNSRAAKLSFGHLVNNAALTQNSKGTLGIYPTVRQRGQTYNSGIGAFGKANLNDIIRIMSVQGNAQDQLLVTDINFNINFQDGLANEFPQGAWCFGDWSDIAARDRVKRAALAFGFATVSAHGFNIALKKIKGLNSESLLGQTPAIDAYRNTGLMLPMGETMDAKGTEMARLSLLYKTPINLNTAARFLGSHIQVWENGGASKTHNTTKMDSTVSMLAYEGFRMVGAHQAVFIQA